MSTRPRRSSAPPPARAPSPTATTARRASTPRSAEVTAKWDTYYILPAGASYVGDAQVLGFWRDLLGQNVIELANLDAVCETIALTVGLGEDAISLDDGLADLGDVGWRPGRRCSKALAVIGAGRPALEAPAAPGAPGPDDLDGPSGNIRL